MNENAAIRTSLERMILVAPGEQATFEPLAGGVSSDIRLVTLQDRRFCIKRALARLKVAAVWEVPVSRSASEAAWLRVANVFQPGLAPKVIGEDREMGFFAMEYLEPASNPVWKAKLLAGLPDAAFAGMLGERFGALHSAAAGDSRLAAEFANDALFEAIRLEPYLRATALAHPDLADRLDALADRTAATRLTLVHGDLSPKNILVGHGGPVVIDAECAWYGDPAFDIAFCLNHLLIKSVHVPAARAGMLASFDAFAESYLDKVDWEARADLEEREATLLPGLLLARMDGKSPVEYLDDDDRRTLRQAARRLLFERPSSLSDIRKDMMFADA